MYVAKDDWMAVYSTGVKGVPIPVVWEKGGELRPEEEVSIHGVLGLMVL